MNRHWKRLGVVSQNALSQMLPAIMNLLLSVVIFQKYSGGHGTYFWGLIVSIQIIIYFITGIINYGSREHLLKAFSENPSGISSYFRLSFFTRALLLIPAYFLISVLYYSVLQFEFYNVLIVWVVAKFISSSFDSYILYSKRFKAAIIPELVTSTGLIVWVYFSPANEAMYSVPSSYMIVDVIYAMSIAYMLKAIIQLVLFRSLFDGSPTFIFNLSLFKFSFPFAALAITGMIQSRADQALVMLMLDETNLARYQVLAAFLLLMQAIPGFIVAPFLKGIYKVNSHSLKKIRRSIMIAGLAISSIGITILYLLIPNIYGIQLDPILYIISFAYVFTTYLFFIDIYVFYKEGKAMKVLVMSLASAMVGVLMGYLLIPHLQLEGAMLANLASQVILGIYFISTRNNNSTEPEQQS